MSIRSIPHKDSLGKYLGCPVFQGKPSKTTFQEIISKATFKLAGWKANFLSKAGRSILIQSHLESLPAHTMQCFQLPQSTSNHINKISRDFFWQKSDTEKGQPLLAWDKVCMPKSKGGLGLRKIESVNKAFQCKLAWKVLTNETSLWIQLLKDKYLKDTTLFKYKKKNTDSPVWKSLLSCRDLLRQGLMWKLGNGKQISFWFDNWIGNFTLADTINLPVEALPSPEARVSDFILQSHTWDIDKLKQTLSDHSIITKIQGITIPVHDMENSFCWGLHSLGNFSTKSAMWLACGP